LTPNVNLIFDTATVVLIWAVQLAIYPGLTYYSHKDLRIWHRSYTKRITVIVLPLMFGQLAFSVGEAIADTSYVTILKLGMILIVWVLTFSIFVPLHNSIEKSNEIESTAITEKLVNKNWWRTLFWTLVFVLSAYKTIIYV
jgi:hypothetical protein